MKCGEDRTYDAFGPPLSPPSSSDFVGKFEPIRPERYCKTIGGKRISLIAIQESTLTPEAEVGVKKVKALKEDMKRAALSKVIPNLIQPAALFIIGNFIGADKYTIMTRTNEAGVVFKRLVLLDGTIAHDWIITSDRKLFKIEGNSVLVKKPRARGLVNVTRTVRPLFVSLVAKNFPDMKHEKDEDPDAPC